MVEGHGWVISNLLNQPDSFCIITFAINGILESRTEYILEGCPVNFNHIRIGNPVYGYRGVGIRNLRALCLR